MANWKARANASTFWTVISKKPVQKRCKPCADSWESCFKKAFSSPTKNVEYNLDFVLRATEWKDAKARRNRIVEVLEQVGMADKRRRYPHELSGGERQRIGIARALLNHPKLILADEPTGNLDQETGTQIMELLRKLNAAGTAVVMVTHNQSFLSRYPGKVIQCANSRLQDVSAEYAARQAVVPPGTRSSTTTLLTL